MNKPRNQRPNQRNSSLQHNAKARNKSTNSIRIIAGTHRGRKLPVLDAQGLRPTTDRVKETVFNWLMPYITDSHCLDCFAGAGSLGFEALSRGASTVTMIELDNNAASQLKQNRTLLKADNVNIIAGNTLDVIKKNQQSFDVVFIDPPFRKELVPLTIDLLNSERLNTGALIYIEMETENSDILVPANWQLLKEKTAGQVSYRLFQYQQ